MSTRTLLQIVQTAQQELGLAQATTVIGNSDLTTNQLLGFAQSEIEEIFQKKTDGWTVLQKEYNLVVEVPTSTTGDIVINSAIITNIPSTVGLLAGFMAVTGNAIPQGARILSVDSATQITMTMDATETVVAADLLFARDMYPEPSDFTYFIGDTWWDRTNRWQLLGPTSPQEDQWHLSGIVATGPRRYFRQIGSGSSNYRIWPPPAEITEPIQLVFEYVSNLPIRSSVAATTFIQYWDADTNVPLLSDRAIIMGLKWRFWEQKGFNWLSKRKEYDDYVDRLIARDGGAGKLSLVPNSPSMYITPQNVQDGNFPG